MIVILFHLVKGILNSAPVLLPGRHPLNAGLLAANIGAMCWFLTDPSYASGISMLTTTSALSAIMGVS